MNIHKTKIEWCSHTWNPVTGCLHDCHYCYAAKLARRFSGDVRLNKGSDQLQKDENGLYILEKPFKNQVTGKVTPFPVGFEPILHCTGRQCAGTACAAAQGCTQLRDIGLHHVAHAILMV